MGRIAIAQQRGPCLRTNQKPYPLNRFQILQSPTARFKSVPFACLQFPDGVSVPRLCRDLGQFHHAVATAGRQQHFGSRKNNGSESFNGRKDEFCIGRALTIPGPTLHRARREFLYQAFSWGHRNAGGTCHSDKDETAGITGPRIPGRARVWCGVHDHCHTLDSFYLRCTQTVQVCVSLATHDSAG